MCQGPGRLQRVLIETATSVGKFQLRCKGFLFSPQRGWRYAAALWLRSKCCRGFLLRAFSNKAALDPGSAPAYTGPGDVIAFSAWYSCTFGYSASYASGGANPACDVVNTATGLTTCTFHVAASGTVSPSKCNGSACAVACSVKKAYDPNRQRASCYSSYVGANAAHGFQHRQWSSERSIRGM